MLSSCSDEEWEVFAPTLTSDRVCAPLTTCDPTEYESAPPGSYHGSYYGLFTHTSRKTDRECKPIRICRPTEYEAHPPGPTFDRVCKPLRVCGGTEFETLAPSATQDRECQYYTVCGRNQFRTRLPTYTSDRLCQDVQECNPHGEVLHYYESVPNTATADRTCTALTMCDYSYQIVVEPPTEWSDRKCKSITTCTSSEYEALPPTRATDR